jgi:RNA 2',3'-cyclic 3'-phosphodiesterase
METIRAFVALDLPVELIKKAADLQSELHQRAKLAGLGVAWVPANNMHVTLKFLAEIPQESVWAVRDRLGDLLRPMAPFSVVVRETGAFPSRERPRILWVGLTTEGEHLVQLAREIDQALTELGFAREERPFHPHLTLGRVKQGAVDVLEGLEQRELGTCTVQEVVLYQSVLRRQGAQYTMLARIPLASSKE